MKYIEMYNKEMKFYLEYIIPKPPISTIKCNIIPMAHAIHDFHQ